MILVTTDGSRRAKLVLPHAVHLAQALGVGLRLIRVLDPRADVADEYAPTVAEATERVATRWRSEMQSAVTGLSVPTSVEVVMKERREDVADAILRAAMTARARMIAMSTRGAGLVSTAVLGSVATTALRKSSVPLLLTGPKTRPPDGSLPAHLLITTDGSGAAESILPALRDTLAGAPADGVRLTLFRAYAAKAGDPDAATTAERCQQQLNAFKRRAPRRFPIATEVRDQRRSQDAYRTIVAAAREQGVSAIWIATHGHSFRRRILLGSVALSTVGESPIPVILTRAAM